MSTRDHATLVERRCVDCGEPCRAGVSDDHPRCDDCHEDWIAALLPELANRAVSGAADLIREYNRDHAADER